MDSILAILKRLSEHEVEFVVIGGMAAVLHGSSVVTQDLDVAVPLDERNSRRILQAIAGLHPTHRMTPARKPLCETPEQLSHFENLYLHTDLGQVDFLGRVAGIGDFAEVKRRSLQVELEGRRCRVLDLDGLIRSKEAMNRPHDQQALIQLRALRDRIRSSGR